MENEHRMTLLGLILVLVTLFEVGSSQEQIHRFYQPGQDVILPCGPYSSRGPQCSNIRWLYNRDSSETKNVVSNGKVDRRSQRAAQLSVNTDCSLVIRQTTAGDVGFFTCRPYDNDDRYDVRVYLSHLNISSFGQTRDDEVTLECSLLRYERLPECRPNPLRWVDGTGTELREGVSKLNNGTNCFYRLTVKRQSGNNRRYACQYVNKENHVAIQAEYTPVFTAPASTDSSEWCPLSYIMLTLRVLELICISIITVKVYRLKGSIKPLRKDSSEHDVIELNYENIEERPSAAARH
ncbi:uncharacterized protein LOC119476890 [Xyrichtys novacula]|uniref:Uncharacterized protein LOC119476890 n=1 Tax=Xyrichtys novacula TaxID=13765 RepID=A0AAV1GWZ5_XYRNO|nr:uncharacterized protein LOC119476890 [Xyrichtys novacula]